MNHVHVEVVESLKNAVEAELNSIIHNKSVTTQRNLKSVTEMQASHHQKPAS